ncbi:hypothetical protein GF406_10805 [candidate division KSB1 bacterium]|jgi:rubrerythrin|nr:hypothetical protein [candidate division KSB1 bacterium]
MTALNNDELVSMQDILRMAIEREQEAYEFYIKAKEHARTPVEEQMFQELADEELVHKEELEKKLQDLDAQADIDRALSYDVY